MKHEIKKERFEFLLYINGNIICQRYFDIKGYNPRTLNSKELFLLTDAVTSRLKHDLKEKSKIFLWEMYNPYKAQTQFELDEKKSRRLERPAKNDEYQFAIQVDGHCVAKSMIDANVYPTGDKYNKGVRYNVDIKAIIPSIIREIRNVMTSDEYSLKYESSDFNTYLI
jgi:hypothetical protein